MHSIGEVVRQFEFYVPPSSRAIRGKLSNTFLKTEGLDTLGRLATITAVGLERAFIFRAI